jgi:hypothetical protein
MSEKKEILNTDFDIFLLLVKLKRVKNILELIQIFLTL